LPDLVPAAVGRRVRVRAAIDLVLRPRCARQHKKAEHEYSQRT